MADKNTWLKRRKRVCEIIEVGYDVDWPSRLYDLVNALAILSIWAPAFYTPLRRSVSPLGGWCSLWNR